MRGAFRKLDGSSARVDPVVDRGNQGSRPTGSWGDHAGRRSPREAPGGAWGRPVTKGGPSEGG